MSWRQLPFFFLLIIYFSFSSFALCQCLTRVQYLPTLKFIFKLVYDFIFSVDANQIRMRPILRYTLLLAFAYIILWMQLIYIFNQTQTTQIHSLQQQKLLNSVWMRDTCTGTYRNTRILHVFNPHELAVYSSATFRVQLNMTFIEITNSKFSRFWINTHSSPHQHTHIQIHLHNFVCNI